jgi:hypothetical protein
VVIADYKHGIEDNEVFNALQNMADNTVQFCLQQPQLYQPGDDYQELLELTLIFLGVVPPTGIHLIKPGAMHRAPFLRD